MEPQETEFQQMTQQRAKRHAMAALSQTQASAPRDLEVEATDDSNLA